MAANSESESYRESSTDEEEQLFSQDQLLEVRDYFVEFLADLSPMFDPEVNDIGGYTLADCIMMRARASAVRRQRETREELNSSDELSDSSQSSRRSNGESQQNSTASTCASTTDGNIAGPSRKRKRKEMGGSSSLPGCSKAASNLLTPPKKTRYSSGNSSSTGRFSSLIRRPLRPTCRKGESSSAVQSEIQGSRDDIVALDCEVISCRPSILNSILPKRKKKKKAKEVSVAGHCAIVDYNGKVLYDSYICPDEQVTHYRGISRDNIKNGTPFEVAREEIMEILKCKTVVIHDADKDLKYLKIHSLELPLRKIKIWDTSTCPLLSKKASKSLGVPVGFPNASLKDLAKGVLGKRVQKKKPHNPVEDAKVAMELYRCVEKELENGTGAISDSNTTATDSSSSISECSESEWSEAGSDSEYSVGDCSTSDSDI